MSTLYMEFRATGFTFTPFTAVCLLVVASLCRGSLYAKAAVGSMLTGFSAPHVDGDWLFRLLQLQWHQPCV